MTFDDLGLDPKIMKAIQEVGYTEPTPIQAQAIPVVLQGKDVLGIAQTGTGKTASFTLPMIHRLMKGRAKARMPRTLILEPTRELAAQVAENFDLYGKHTRLTKALLIGGVSFKDQEIAITRGADVLIATPGRLLDHVERGGVLLRGVEVLVIDEADRMLDMGFIPDIEKIVKLLPFTRQTLFFSATMPPEITRLADQFLSAPERIEVARPSSANATVTHKLVPTTREGKRETLRALLRRDNVKNGIIFCNRKKDISVLNGSMTKHGFAAVCLHGDMDQYTRMDMLGQFKSGSAKFLIASDVAARGLDIPDVSHVFNFDVPSHAEDYVHRIGRTGRAGKTGEAFTLSTPSDGKYVDAIEKMLDQKIDIEKIDTPAPRKTRQNGDQKNQRRKSGQDNDREPQKEDTSNPVKGKRRGLLGRKGKKQTPSQTSAQNNVRDNEKDNIKDDVKDAAKDTRPTSENKKTSKKTEPSRQQNTQAADHKRGNKHTKGFGDKVPAFMKNSLSD